MVGTPVQGNFGEALTVNDLIRVFGQAIVKGGITRLIVSDLDVVELLKSIDRSQKAIVSHLEIITGDVIEIG